MRQQHLRALRAALDERVLQRQRRHGQACFADPGQDFFRRLRTRHAPQTAEGGQARFHIPIAQSFRQSSNTLGRACSPERHERAHTPPSAKLSRLKNPLLDQSAGPQKLQQFRRVLRTGSLQRIQCHGFDDPAIECLLAPGLVGNFAGNQRIPSLTIEKNVRVAFTKVMLAVRPPEQDECEQQGIHGKRHENGLGHECRRRRQAQLAKNGAHSSIRNSRRFCFGCASDRRHKY